MSAAALTPRAPMRASRERRLSAMADDDDPIRKLVEQKHDDERQRLAADQAAAAHATERARLAEAYSIKSPSWWHALQGRMLTQLADYNRGVSDLADKQLVIRPDADRVQAWTSAEPERRLSCWFDRPMHIITAEYTFKRVDERAIYHYAREYYVAITAAGELQAFARSRGGLDATAPPPPDDAAPPRRIGFHPGGEPRPGEPVDVAAAVVVHFLERV